MKRLQIPSGLLFATSIFLSINCWPSFHGMTKATVSNRQLVQKNSKKTSQSEKLDFSRYGRPGKRTGGGSRSLCPSTIMPLTALVPASNIGTTVSDRSNFWFYVPYDRQQATAGEFVLQDKQENDVYRQIFNLPQTPGIVSLKLSQAAPALTVDRSYRWYFKLYCGDSSSATANFVEGWVVRIALPQDLNNRLKRKKNRAYKEYSNDSIWYDALNSLARLRSENDNPQLKRDWNELLNAEGVNLDELAPEPLTGNIINRVQNQ